MTRARCDSAKQHHGDFWDATDNNESLIYFADERTLDCHTEFVIPVMAAACHTWPSATCKDTRYAVASSMDERFACDGPTAGSLQPCQSVC